LRGPAAEGLALETLPEERAGEFYEEVTRGLSASHHLQVKGGSFRVLPLTKKLSASLEEWFTFLEGVEGLRLAGGVGLLAISINLSWPGRRSL
jgi:hypothetical protein